MKNYNHKIIAVFIVLSVHFLSSKGYEKNYGQEPIYLVAYEKDPTLFDQVGHLYEGIRYGLKGISSAVGAKIGYVTGGIHGAFDKDISVKRAAAYNAHRLAPIVQKPFKTRPLHDYAQRYIQGRKKYPYYKEKR